MQMRCFIAINLDDSLKENIDQTIAPLRKGAWDIRWVPAQNLHITLKFLGEIPDSSINGIHQGLSSATAYHKPFLLRFRGFGVFPSERKPRVVWINIEDAGGLRNLHKDIENVMELSGFEKETRPFSPHLTLGRVGSSRGMIGFFRAVETLENRDFGNIEIMKISLMKSELKPAGARYTTMADFAFTKEEQ